MAGNTSGDGGGPGKVPPRPGGKRPAPKRPTPNKPPANYAARSGRPPQRAGQRTSARQAVQQRRQRNIYIAGGSVSLVVVLIAIFVVAKLAGGGSGKVLTNKNFPSDTFALTSALVNPVETVPLSKLVSAAEAALKEDKKSPDSPAVFAPYKIKGSSLTSGGRPEMLFIGAEYCPFCAAERWTMVMALSQFGTLSGLRGTASSSTDLNPSTPTFSFYNASYNSKYLSFVPVEEATVSEAALQKPTAAQNAIIQKWDVSPYTTEDGSIPFIYIDGKYLVTGLQYGQTVAGNIPKQFDSAVPYMTSGTNTTSKDAMAAAGFLVGDLCTVTHNQPSRVCAAVPANLKGVNAATESTGGNSSPAPKSSQTTSTTAKSK